MPPCDFTITLWTSSKANAFKASRKGDKLENCFIDGGQIHVVCKNHRMGAGELHAEFHAELPNDIYPEGIQNRYEPRPLDIRLVTGAGECPVEMEAEMHLPVIAIGNNTGDNTEVEKPTVYSFSTTPPTTYYPMQVYNSSDVGFDLTKLKAGDILDISFVIATGVTGRVQIKLKDNADIAREALYGVGDLSKWSDWNFVIVDLVNDQISLCANDLTLLIRNVFDSFGVNPVTLRMGSGWAVANTLSLLEGIKTWKMKISIDYRREVEALVYIDENLFILQSEPRIKTPANSGSNKDGLPVELVSISGLLRATQGAASNLWIGIGIRQENGLIAYEYLTGLPIEWEGMETPASTPQTFAANSSGDDVLSKFMRQ